jgi:predicted RNA-binding protein Jag
MSRIFRIGLCFAAIFVSCGILIFPQQISTTALAGGRGGNPFTDSQPAAGARVGEIRIQAGDTIDSLQMVYALANGQATSGPRHGGSGGRPATFTLEVDEYVVGLAGRYGDTIDSLSILTNKRQSQVFGGRGGDRDFRIEVPAGYQAIGFTGRAGDTLDAIGLIYTPIYRRSGTFGTSQYSLGQYGQVQLAGGGGGRPFGDQNVPSGARIAEIRVRAGDTIDAVQVVYQLIDGRTLESSLHGGGGGRLYSVRFDADEYLVAIAGRYGDTLDSLSIITNKRQSQIFGGRGGSTDFRIEVPQENRAIGFVGRAGDTVDAIGLAYEQVSTRLNSFGANNLPSVPLGRSGQTGQTQMAGGRSSRAFTDQNIPSGARVAEIRVRAGNAVEAIQAIYQTADGRFLESDLHGISGNSGRGLGGFGARGNSSQTVSFRLDSDEYVIALTGRSSDRIYSLSIVTNKRQSQIFGGRGGSADFRIEVPQGNRAIGFIGREGNGNALEAIGLLYEPLPQRSTRPGIAGAPAGAGAQFLQGQLLQTQMAGGGGGREFADQDLPPGTRLAEIRIRAGDAIDAIQAIYATTDGRYIESSPHGGSGGRLFSFRFDSDEYLIALVGRHGNTINSLSIVTNKRQSQVYGGRGGDRDFRIEVPQGNQAIGFFGRSGDAVDAIGLLYTRTGYRR